jgi:16S rRNA (guanine966-N2)-methyltransferase
LRIIAGAWRGRRLSSPAGDTTRPTSDRVREALASALDARGAFQGGHVLDLFAGTGALGLEALSRGAERLLAVEHERRALRCLRDNVAALGAQERCTVLSLDVLGPAAAVFRRLQQSGLAPFTLVFADPPYALAIEAARRVGELHACGLLGPSALIAFEHGVAMPPSPPEGLDQLARYTWGDTAVALWQPAPTP